MFQISDVHPCCFYKSQGIKKTEQQGNNMKDTISLYSDIHVFTFKMNHFAYLDSEYEKYVKT